MKLYGASPVGCLLAAALTGCSPTRSHLPLEVHEIPSPAGQGSGQPNLTAGMDGGVVLSWVEKQGEGHALRYSRWNGNAWSSAATAAKGADWFVNWADFPSVTPVGTNALLAHWLQKTAGETYAYGVRLARSEDGAHWDQPVTPHDASPTEHGFVSTVVLAGGRTLVVWLDGRETAAGGPMALRSAVYAADGRLERADLLDSQVCDCCQTSAVRLGKDGAAVVYRDRSQTEVRDISIAIFDGAKWSSPRSIHQDGWTILGCPVNGPSVAAYGNRMAVAWFTRAGSTEAHVRMAFSEDGGQTFGLPRDLDEGHPVGRVDVELLDQDTAVVTWVEGSGEQARILARQIGTDWMQSAITVAETTAARSTGFPRMSRSGSQLLVAWVDPSQPPRVRTAKLMR